MQGTTNIKFNSNVYLIKFSDMFRCIYIELRKSFLVYAKVYKIKKISKIEKFAQVTVTYYQKIITGENVAKYIEFLISNFRRVPNVVCFLLGNSPATEFYMPTFRNTISVPSS
jgi:hypothetical protein